MKKTTNSSPYQFEGRIPLSQAIPLGLQHVMAMFIGNLTPLIIVMGSMRGSQRTLALRSLEQLSYRMQ